MCAHTRSYTCHYANFIDGVTDKDQSQININNNINKYITKRTKTNKTNIDKYKPMGHRLF